MMKWAQIAFIFRRVLKSFREVFWTHLLTSGTMAVTLFIFGGFLLIQQNLQGLLKGWGSRIQLFAYLDTSTPAADTESLLARVNSYPEIERSRFVSQKEAWEGFKKSLGSQSGVLEGLSAEILPASLEITLKTAYRNHGALTEVVKRLSAEKGIGEVEYPEEWMEKFSLLLLGVQWAQWVLGGFLFAAALLIIGNTVKLAILARKDEIEIMQLVGARRLLIKAPFVLEGMVQGLLGAGLAVLCLWQLFISLTSQLPGSLGILAERAQLQFLDPDSLLFLVGLGWAMGTLGSLLSLRRFLKRW